MISMAFKEMKSAKNLEICRTFYQSDDDSLYSLWLKQVNLKFKEIENYLKTLNLPEERSDLDLKLLDVKVLSKLDEYLDMPSSVEFNSFMSLYYYYLNLINKDVENLFNVCKQQIDSRKYLKLSYNLKNFNANTDTKKLSLIRNYLIESLVDLLNEIKEKISTIKSQEESNQETETGKCLAGLAEAKRYLEDFIKQDQSILETLRSELKSLVFDDLREKIVQLIKRFEFINAEKLLNILKKLKSLAELLNDEESLDFIKNLNGIKNYPISLNSLDKFADYDMKSNYRVLSESEEFDEIKTKTDEAIILLFKNELDKAKQNNSHECLTQCKSIADNFLPVQFKMNFIDSLIREAEAIIESNSLDNELSNKEDLLDENLLNKYNKYIEKNDRTNAEKIEVFFFKQVEKTVNCFEDNFKNSNYNDCINKDLKAFLSIQKVFQKSLPRIRDIYMERYLPKLNEIASKYLLEFETGLVNQTSKILIDIVINHYQLLFDLSNIQSEVNKNSTNNVVSQMNKILKDTIDKNQKKTNNGLNNGDFLFTTIFDSYKQALVLCKTYRKIKMINPIIDFELEVDESQIRQIISNQASTIITKLNQTEFIADSKNKFKKEYDEFFENLFKKLNDAKLINDNLVDLDLPANKELDLYIEHLMNEINSIYAETDKIFKKIITNLHNNSMGNDTEVVYGFLNGFYNLKSFQEKSKTYKDSAKLRLTNTNFEAEFLSKIRETCEEFLKSIENKEVEIAAQDFCKTKQLSQIFFIYKSTVDSLIDIGLNKYIESKGFQAIGALGTFLKSLKIGSIMLTEHKIFESYQRSLFMSKTKLRDINIVLEELNKKNKDINDSELKKFYAKYDEVFKKVVNDNLSSKLDLSNITSDIKQKKLNNSDWDNYTSEILPTVLGNIFGLWTLLNAKDFIKMNTSNLSSSNNSQYLFQAHPAQVLSIGRMLGVGYNPTRQTINSCLIQIGTGEGKSITLAITAILLTLMGYEVYCVCYSKYLSDRDFAAFKELFETLNLTQFIHYGTFFEICEQIINEQGDLRKLVEHFILNNEIKLKNNSDCPQRPKILLIDEVDVFFSKDFYGNDYKPCLNLSDPTISNLIDYIWSKRHDSKNISLNSVENSQEYKNVCSKLGNDWKPVINSALRSMISELSSIQAHQYVVKDDKIGYVELDNISFNINYGYKTLFAYYSENEKSRISKQSLDKMKSIMIKLGSFSLAEIPKIGFKYILGVTGTLDTLNKKQKEIIENDYSVRQKTIIPSVYGASKLIFDIKSDVKISNEENYLNSIVSEIKSRIIGKDQEKRAVFVFFENKKELIEFKDCQEFQPFIYQTKILTEEANIDEKRNIVNNSATSNQIVLFTKVFGRGTDFITHDEIVKKSGIHVIQAFLSDELSEETQIKGRTARQGDNGSYSMVLFDKKLEKYQLFQNDISKMSPSEYYAVLNNKRNQLFEDSYSETIKYVEKLKEKHDASIEFINGLENKNQESVRNYLIKLNENKSLLSNSASKTLILIDGTGSVIISF